MEHNILLQKMEILSRKISKLKDNSISVKVPPPSVYNKSSNYSAAWQSHGRLHNKSQSKAMTGVSKYRYMKKPTNIVSANLSAVTYNKMALPLPVSLAPKPMLQAARKVHVNPHFKAQCDTKKPMDILVGSPEIFHSKEEAPIPNHANVLKKVVYVNPAIFNSNKSFQPIKLAEVEKKSLTHLPLVDKPSQDTKHFIHVNRSLLPTKSVPVVSKTDTAKTSVHVNPQVFARLKSEVKKEKPVLKELVTTPVNRLRKLQENNSSHKSLISISRMKLVSAKKFSQQRTPSNQYSVVRKTRLLSTSKVASSPLVKIAKNVRSKYNYIRQHSANSTAPANSSQLRKVLPTVRTKYKLDRRSHRTPKPYKNQQKFSLKYEKSKFKLYESNLQGIKQRKRYSSINKSPFGNRVWGNVDSWQPKRVLITNQKLLRIGSSPIVKRTFPAVQSSTLVRIGGILYKTSRTQLTRTNSAAKPKSMTRSRVLNKSPISQKPRIRGGHIVSVRGDRFLMDPRGRTLKRVSTNDHPSSLTMKKVHIGGATFIQATPNVLIRTNRHNVRSLLSQAKQKSIAQLAHMRKNNTICKFYRRFGKCFRNEKNRCPCVHDKKYVAICKGFLNGKCEKDGCLLSHELIPEKMATCKYFLQVCCARDNCPFLHIKLQSDAPLCIGFLQGYCPDGLACRKWHFNICPQFDKAGSCTKGKYCPFPHVQRKYTDLNLDHMRLDILRIVGMYADRLGKMAEEKPKEESFRYFHAKRDSLEAKDEDESANEEQSSNLDMDLPMIESKSEECSNSDSQSDTGESQVARRLKIGFLPSYVPICRAND